MSCKQISYTLLPIIIQISFEAVDHDTLEINKLMQSQIQTKRRRRNIQNHNHDLLMLFILQCQINIGFKIAEYEKAKDDNHGYDSGRALQFKALPKVDLDKDFQKGILDSPQNGKDPLII